MREFEGYLAYGRLEASYLRVRCKHYTASHPQAIGKASAIVNRAISLYLRGPP